MNRQAAVIEACREAVAILEGNHPAGDFVNPAEVAREALTAALVAYDSPDVVDGGYAWDSTIAGMTLTNGDGRIVARIDSSATPEGKHEREELAHNIAAALNLATYRAPAKVKGGA